MMVSAAENIARLGRLESDRSNFDTLFADIRRYCRPVSEPFVGRDLPGSPLRDDILDNSSETQFELLAATINGLATNQQIAWFMLVPANPRLAEDREASLWLDETSRRILSVFNSPRSNFYAQLLEYYLDLVNFGTADMFVGDREGELPIFQTRPTSQVYIAEAPDGSVDTVFWKFPFTARQAFAQWGGAVAREVADKAGDPKKQDDKHTFLHATYPNTAREGEGADRDKPFRSVWIDIDHKHEIKASGFEEFPWMVTRWSKRSGEIYGRSPAMKALPDVKMLQRVMKATIRGAEKAISPPIMVGDDGVLGQPTLASNGVNVVRSELLARGGAPIKAVLTGARPDIGEDFMQAIRARIEQASLSTLFRPPQDPRMTATQVLTLAEEQARTISPVLGRLQSEFLSPLIDRVLAIGLRAGWITVPPEILQGQVVKAEYVSPIANSQRISEARAVAQTFEAMAPFAQFDPAIKHIQDVPETYRHVAQLLGQPPKLLRSREDAEARAAAEAEQAQAAAQAQQLGELGRAGGSAAPLIQALQNANGGAA